MKYLVDTCVISDFIKGEPGTLTQVNNIPPHQIAVSSVTVMELYYGVALEVSRTKKILPVIEIFLQSVVILPFREEDAKKAAQLRAYLKSKGLPIGSYDILIAGTALNHQLTLVTANAKEFNRLPQLQLENWRN